MKYIFIIGDKCASKFKLWWRRWEIYYFGKSIWNNWKQKIKAILSRMGYKNRNMCVICIKIFFMSLFFNYDVSKVIYELNNKRKLRKFSKIYEVPTEEKVSENFSRFNVIQYYNMVNSLLKMYFKR